MKILFIGGTGTISTAISRRVLDKIACEEFLMAKYREEAFPVTIVRPSHTYDERNVPLGVELKTVHVLCLPIRNIERTTPNSTCGVTGSSPPGKRR
jgi:nucleoside-diphosphate-sugar epimerase